MRNLTVILSIAFSVFVMGFIVSFDEILRLHDGEVQVMEGGEWRCVNPDIRRIANANETLQLNFEATDPAYCDVAITDGSELLYNLDTKLLTISDANEVKVEDSFVRHLAESGRICEVLGHQWEDYVYTYALHRPNVVGDQRCGLCGKTRELIQKWEEQ